MDVARNRLLCRQRRRCWHDTTPPKMPVTRLKIGGAGDSLTPAAAPLSAAGEQRATVWRWLFSDAVVSVVVGVMISEAVLRALRTVLDNALEPPITAGVERVLNMRMPSRGDATSAPPSSCSITGRLYRIALALIEFAVVVTIAYVLARRAAQANSAGVAVGYPAAAACR